MEAENALWLPSDEELNQLSDDELREVMELLAELRRSEGEVWVAQPKQALASELAGEAVETLYGGAAGGGKSEWLLHYGLAQMLKHPYNYGAIFRRVYPSLIGTLIPRSHRIYPQFGGKWNGQTHRWTFPNGSVLLFGSLQYDTTVLEHQGAEFGWLGFEEVTEFMEAQVGYMLGRLRAPGPGIRPHMAATANPGGHGHRWVKRRWVKPKDGDWDGADIGIDRPVPFQVWDPVSTTDNPNPTSRCFVPATLADNPALMHRDPEYVNRLRNITDKALRKAMETGDWDAIDAIEGALWLQSWLDAGRDLRHKRNYLASERVVAIDPSDGNETGKGDEFGVCVASKGQDGVGRVEFSDGWLASPRKMAAQTVALYNQFNCDAIIVERNHGGRWVKEVLLQQDRYANVIEVWASEGKITRARPVAALFEPDPARQPPIRAVLAGHFEHLEEELTSFSGQPGEVSPNQLDAMVWALSHLMLTGREARDAGSYVDERLSGRR